MVRQTELLVKRIVLAVVGITCLVPTAWIGREIVARPTAPGVTLLAVMLVGAAGGPFLISRWERWSALQPQARWGAILATSYLTPFLLALLAQFDHPEDLLTVNLPLAVGVAALWWTWRGYRLDPSGPPDASP